MKSLQLNTIILSVSVILTSLPSFGDPPPEGYSLGRTFVFPGGFQTAIDVFDDGRLVSYLRTGPSTVELYVETSVSSSNFNLLATFTVPAIGLFETFLQLSPDETQVAFGDFDNVFVCDLQTTNCTVFPVAHFDGTWIDNRYFATTQSLSGTTSVLDTQSAVPANPSNEIFIDNIPGTTAGLSLDRNDNLIVATYNSINVNAEIRFFSNADWTNAQATMIPLDYSSDGILLGELKTGINIGFDAFDNLHVAGGSSVLGGALIPRGLIEDIIGGSETAFDSSTPDILYFIPDGNCFYNIDANPINGEIYVQCFGGNIAYVYKPLLVSVPVPFWAIGLLFTLLLSIGVRSNMLNK